MRRLLIICLVACWQPVSAQGETEQLALKLTATCTSEKEKVTRIFRWITDHIAYRTRRDRIPVIGAASRRFSRMKPDTDTGALKPLNERVAEMVLASRLALCDGYARLFTALCTYAGIPSEVIVGYARSQGNKPGPTFGVNHYWNAVFFDGRWHLLDATWASGYVARNGMDFVRDFDGFYFLTDPALFIRDHFPDDPRWTLLTDQAVPEEFRYTPFKQKSFVKYSIRGYTPERGIIEASVGDVIRLELETTDPAKDNRISPDLLMDSAIYTHSASWVFLEPVHTLSKTSAPHTFLYEYKVENPVIEWLYLKYNDDLVLRYKINIRKKKTG